MDITLFNDIVDYLNAKRVPFYIKTEYKDSKPHTRKLSSMVITKEDRFYRVNGKIVSKNFAKTLMRVA